MADKVIRSALEINQDKKSVRGELLKQQSSLLNDMTNMTPNVQSQSPAAIEFLTQRTRPSFTQTQKRYGGSYFYVGE